MRLCGTQAQTHGDAKAYANLAFAMEYAYMGYAMEYAYMGYAKAYANHTAPYSNVYATRYSNGYSIVLVCAKISREGE